MRLTRMPWAAALGGRERVAAFPSRNAEVRCPSLTAALLPGHCLNAGNAGALDPQRSENKGISNSAVIVLQPRWGSNRPCWGQEFVFLLRESARHPGPGARYDELPLDLITTQFAAQLFRDEPILVKFASNRTDCEGTLCAMPFLVER